MIQHGLNPLKEDSRDLHLGGIIDLPKDVPDFILDGGWANNHVQEEDDCSAFAMMLMRELRENIELDREFQFAAMKSQTGDPESFGGDLRDAAAVPVKIGALPYALRPVSLIGKPLSFLRYIANWGNVKGLLELARQHPAKSYAFIRPQGMDAFDSIAGTMYYWLQKGEKRAVGFGTWWDWSLSDYIIDKWTGRGTGHAMTYIGKLTVNGVPYLVAQQNYGASAGKNGVHLFSREVVNESFKVFGAVLFTSFTPDELRTMMENGYKLDADATQGILKAIMLFVVDLLTQLKDKLRGKKTGCVMLWDTPEHIRRNVRVMCDEAGLSLATKNIICAIIKQESNWNPNVISKTNFDGTRDWGLLQINDHKGYHIGAGLYFASTDEVLNNPQKSVQFIIQMAKAKRLDLWSSYKFGHYLKWLLSESRPSKPY